MIYSVKVGFMTNCLGCGVKLQNVDVSKPGYTKKLDNKFCERCFQIKHYNKYSFVKKSNDDYSGCFRTLGAGPYSFTSFPTTLVSNS